MATCASDHRVVQIIEPDSTLLTATSGGGGDPSLDESGSVALDIGQSTVEVEFETPKASTDYRFEYLYVDAFGVVNPGDIEPVVVQQTHFGFSVDLAGSPAVNGYILRWRVVVTEISTIPDIDTPETIYIQLPQVNLFIINFANPRSSTQYGFSELRVENLVDDPATQSPIHVQVVAKTQSNFTIAINPTPPSLSYFLAVRTP